jgi:phytol kinase
MIHSPWAGIALVLAVLVTLFLVLRVVQLKYSPHPESIRKVLHITMGVVTLAFPWMFAEDWPVVLLAGMSMLLFVLLRFYPHLSRWLGDVIYAVERDSLGEFCFPFSVAVLFLLANGNVLLYSVPILTLALADPVAALIGMRYGRLWYQGVKSRKSVEGSLAFFMVTLVITFLSLQLFTETAYVDGLLIAFNLSALLTLVEAFGSHGLDNFLIPVAGFFLLKNLLSYDLAILLILLVCTIGLTMVLYSWRGDRHQHFSS